MKGHEQGRYQELAKMKFADGINAVCEKRPEFKYNQSARPEAQSTEVLGVNPRSFATILGSSHHRQGSRPPSPSTMRNAIRAPFQS